MYKQVFLKFADENEARNTLLSLGWKEDEETQELVHDTNTIRVLGKIVKTEDVPYSHNANGDPLYHSVVLEGWHVNVLVKEESVKAYSPYAISPVTPTEIFGGY